MGDAFPPSPNPIYLLPPTLPSATSSSPDAIESSSRGGRLWPIRRPPLRFTTEFDSECPLFFHKISCKFFGSLAKLKLSFQNDTKGEIFSPQLGFITKNLAVLYDVESRNTLVKGSFDLGRHLQVQTTYDLQEQLGAIAMAATLPDPLAKLELSSCVPLVRMPRAALKFPAGEVVLEQRDNVKENDEVTKVLAIEGILRKQLLNGVCTFTFNRNDLNLRYSYKDEELSFIPSVNLPSNSLSVAFKRRFNPSDKLSYWYHFDSNVWSTVYKHTISKELKVKAGYDSKVRLLWASLWVGAEDAKTKAAPMKLKAQMMLQIPQDELRNSTLMFRVKKRWDL
ncbi:hypothetical protein HPP92_004092 [Vanilla planifolia]|uniref:Outer envelope pore protein 37, chloroplastic n=1 Tax=Vanilla planifolia TaxID=51239 RepID=A0A835S475_VANPL|nr:hypothetical protein HPP92_004092 [Vanilla planifolia]